MSIHAVSYKYLFGPVPSRRLGLSLGVDLMPHKTCTLDCIYCECGRTDNLTLKRKEYFPTEAILRELKSFLDNRPKLDFVTFSGSGEPTLHSGIGEIVRFLKSKYSQYPIALITNSTLLSNETVLQEILPVDLILPSLDAATKETFARLNRPVEGLEVERIIQGLVNLRERFAGKILLEIFMVPGINDNEIDLQKLKEAIHRIRPDVVQLNSLDRPGTEPWVVSARRQKLQTIADFFEWQTEIIARDNLNFETGTYDFSAEQAILQILKRRPCTIQDLSKSLGIGKIQIRKHLTELLEQEKLITEELESGIFYRLANSEGLNHD